MIVVIVMMFCMVLVAVGAYLFLNRPQEGDECEVKIPDDNAITYEIDDEGKCVLKSCKSGYIKSGKECVVKPPEYSLRDESTPPNDQGQYDWQNGNQIFLGRHDVDCGDDGLNEFKFVENPDTKIKYDYKCLEGINSPSTEKTTPEAPWGSSNTKFLKGLTVDCETKPISQFKYRFDNNNKIYYDYKCSDAPTSGTCRDAESEWSDAGNLNYFLDGQTVSCKSDEVVSKFKLEMNPTDDQWRYNYKCCKM